MKKIALLAAISIALLTQVYAQQTINGRVTDARDGTAMSGVSINIKNSKTGTVSDGDGRFTISASPGSIIVFSYVGFVDKEVRAGDGVANVSMEFAQRNLDEVVITGYSVQTKRQATASVGKLSGGEVKLQPIASFDQLLQGKVAGLLIQSQSGQPGSAASNITIRGKGSVLASTQPLFIVDGV